MEVAQDLTGGKEKSALVDELALGHLPQRASVLDALLRLPQAIVASEAETRHFIDRHALLGRGIGYIDVHLRRNPTDCRRSNMDD